jgi:hypothetical protein
MRPCVQRSQLLFSGCASLAQLPICEGLVIITRWRICRATCTFTQASSRGLHRYLNGASPTCSLLRSSFSSIHATTQQERHPGIALRPPTLHVIGTVNAAGRMKGTRRAHASRRTTAARGLQAPPRTPAPVSRGLDVVKDHPCSTCTNPQGLLCGTAHAPRLPRSTPPIKRTHTSYISTNSPYWLRGEKSQTCGCGTASLQYLINSTDTTRIEVRCAPPP